MNENVNMNEPATDKELENAGFTRASVNHIYKIHEKGFYIGENLNHQQDGFFVSLSDNDEPFLYFEAPTKTELNKMIYPFIKRELDFEAKEKEYSLEECFDGEGWTIFNGVAVHIKNDYVPSGCIAYRTEAQCNQAIALAELSHIIAEIDKDYPCDLHNCRYSFFIIDYDYDTKRLDITGDVGIGRSEYTVTVSSEKGAEILLKQHPKLLKSALMVE